MPGGPQRRGEERGLFPDGRLFTFKLPADNVL